MKRLTNEEKAQLETLYWEELKTLPEIAEMFGVTYPAIRRWFKVLGIPRRSNSQAQRLSNNTTGITPKTLRRLYIDERKPQREIAKIFGISQTAISHAMRLYGIPTRNRNDRFSGPLNPMYGQTHTPEACAKIREANRRQFSDPQARENHARLTARQIANGQTGKTFNKLETTFSELLDRLDIEYLWQYRLGRYVYDFYLPQTNTLIEVHGTFWHADPRFFDYDNLKPTQKRNLANDVKKQQFALDKGFNFLCFWEYDIYNNPQLVRDTWA